MADQALIDNRTDLPNDVVRTAVETYFVENASVLGVGMPSTFQTYATNGGSLLARQEFRTPANIVDEIKLARQFAEADDDIGATIGSMLAVAFGDGSENFHEDAKVVEAYNAAAKHMNLDMLTKEMYREYLIAGAVTTVCLFSREKVRLDPESRRARDEVSMALPLVGVLPAEAIRVVDNDLFRTGTLAYDPTDEPKLARWLEEFFDGATTAAKKAQMRRDDPVAAAMFVEELEDPDPQFGMTAKKVYRLNPRMVHRTTMPKGSWKYPKPPLARDFALLEAKRLLNVMDYALLQGGANFIVIARKGSDQLPAMPEEVENLRGMVRTLGKAGVVVGDHRLQFEIVTPDLTELLNSEKRRLLGRKLAAALLRVPDSPSEDTGGEQTKTDTELFARVVSSDRRDLRRHVENNLYEEIAKRNSSTLKRGAAKLWFPKIVIGSGTQAFTDYVLKLRDRGDIPRKWAVEAAGFDWEAAVAQRERELAENVDETMMPAAIPFDGANGPQDNNSGRPPGSSSANGRPGSQPSRTKDPAAPRQRFTRNAGETVRAYYEGEEYGIVRMGETTYNILSEYPDYEVGRITPIERRNLNSDVPIHDGPTSIIPVNPGYKTKDERAIRLAPGLSIITGVRRDGAIIAKALIFRKPFFSDLDAEETALRWGFEVGEWAADDFEYARKPEQPSPVD